MEALMVIDRQKAIITELIQGKEFAVQLQILLENSSGDDRGFSVPMAKVLDAFTNSLSILKNSGENSDVCQSDNQVGSLCSDDRKSENSGEKRKTPAGKDRRGGYKRRKGAETWIKLSSAPIDDGFSWRKYGQKEILNAKFPRNYFRCTHKNDQGCTATKQVQRIEEDPPSYRTIYMGHHTCHKTMRASQIILDSPSTHSSSYVLNFQSNTTKASHDHHHHHHQILPPFPSIKKEHHEEVPSNHHDNATSSDYLVSPDPSTIEATSGSVADQADTISSSYGYITSSNNLENFSCNFIDESVNFDDVFHFDDDLSYSLNCYM